jgi:hypothetical protein
MLLPVPFSILALIDAIHLVLLGMVQAFFDHIRQDAQVVPHRCAGTP